MIDQRPASSTPSPATARPAKSRTVGDGGPATSAHLNMPSDVAIAPNGDIYIADMHHNRVRKVDAQDAHHHDRRRQRRAGATPATTGRRPQATPGRAGGHRGRADEPDGKVTIFIADYYNGRVRAVGPDGIIRDVERRRARRVRRPDARRLRAAPRLALRRRLEPATASCALNIPRIAPSLRAAASGRCRRGRSADDDATPSALAAPWTLSFLRPYRTRVVAPGGAAARRDRARRAAAVAAQDRHRLRARSGVRCRSRSPAG